MRFRFAGLDLDDEKRVLVSPSGELVLQPRVFDLLVHLVRHRDRVVAMDELVESVWGGAFITDGAVQRAVSMLRSALRELEAEVEIRTYPRQGYRFCAEVVEETERPVSAGDDGAEASQALEALDAARAAFDREDWAEASEKFREADAAGGLSGADLELWSGTAEYLGRLAEAVVPLERAVAAYSASGATCSAARAALRLANVQLERRESAVAWRELSAPSRMAEARLRLADALAAAGDGEGAELEIRAAEALYGEIGREPWPDARREDTRGQNRAL